MEASDIVAYLVLQTSSITTKQFKAHKSPDAYNQFVNGWVKDVQCGGKDRRYRKGKQYPLACYFARMTLHLYRYGIPSVAMIHREGVSTSTAIAGSQKVMKRHGFHVIILAV